MSHIDVQQDFFPKKDWFPILQKVSFILFSGRKMQLLKSMFSNKSLDVINKCRLRVNQLTSTCSKSAIATLEKGVKYVES